MAAKNEKVRSMKSAKVGEAIFVHLMLLYPLVQFAICYVAVNINSILLAFQKYETYTNAAGRLVGEFKFIGFDKFFSNFTGFFTDLHAKGILGTLFKNSIVTYLVSTIIGLPLNIVFAYVIYKKVPCSGFFQVMLYLPQMVSSVVISLMFQCFISKSFPIFMVKILKISSFPLNPLKDMGMGFGMNLFYAIWAGFGTQLILYAGAMARIPDSLIEFGELEGINMLKEFWFVVVPMVYSTITVFLVTGVASIFTSQLALYNFYGGGAPETFQTIGYYIYVQVIGSGDAQGLKQQFPTASAAGLMFTLVAAPVTLVARWALEKYGPNVEF